MVPVYYVDLEQRLRLKKPKTRGGIAERESPPSEIAEDGVVETRELPSKVGPSIVDVGACGGHLFGTRFGFTLERRGGVTTEARPG